MLHRVDSEIQMIEKFTAGDRHSLQDIDKMQHLFRVAEFITENTLNINENEILQ